MTYSPPKRGFPRSRNAMIKELQAACERWARQADDLEVTRDELAAKNRLQAQTLDKVEAERDRLKADYEGACQTVARMHEAAVGEIRGPIRGVWQDVADLRAERDRLREALKEYGQHAEYCPASECLCGFDEALNKADTK